MATAWRPSCTDTPVRLRTRNGKDAARYFPAFAAAPGSGWIAAYEAIVDGEMVALDPDGRPSFSLLQELVRHERPGRQARRSACPG